MKVVRYRSVHEAEESGGRWIMLTYINHKYGGLETVGAWECMLDARY